jgi:hypothetical protein
MLIGADAFGKISKENPYLNPIKSMRCPEDPSTEKGSF